MDKQIINDAKTFCMSAHSGQKRKYSGLPYHVHPFEVAKILFDAGLPQDAVVAGYLHDTIEDTSTTYEDIESEFGKDVADITQEVTKITSKKDGNRATRVKLEIEHLSTISNLAKAVKLADIISNTSDLKQENPEFAKVYFAEKSMAIDVLREGSEELYQKAFSIINN